MKDDMIYRHVAIDALAEEFYHDVEDYRTAVRVVGNLPPAQPEVLACGSGKLVQESDGLVKDLVKDCISRQAAIVAVKDALLAWSSMPEWRDDKITEALVELPSAQPETRNKGKWIPHEDEDGEHYGDKCSECGEWYVMPYGKTNFCPNCGADMRGEHDE